MVSSFFILAARSPTRQRSFRSLVIVHLIIVVASALFTLHARSAALLGNILLITAIVEGAVLLGWRLTQLPKSQALEFLLVSQARPASIFLGEALVGLARLALVTLSGLPLLLWLVVEGMILPIEVETLLYVPFVWGAVAGLGLATWAYEPLGVRRRGERIVGAMILFYLVVGVLAAEHLPRWLESLPAGLRGAFLDGFRGFHEYNPFGVMRFAMEQGPYWAAYRVSLVIFLGAGLCLLCLMRCAARLKSHFHDEHYRPLTNPGTGNRREARPPVPEEPLTWWTERRVSRYSGRINLWLAGGFALLYGAYLVAEQQWPAWLGTQVFLTFERLGGVPVVATALVLLAAVPAAFQYGVWDASVQDRCRRLELLLLTELDGTSYWQASAKAAWLRGRGYFFVAILLLAAGIVAGRASASQALACVAAGVVLWSLYFAIGFWAFSRGSQGAALGVLLSVGLPAATLVVGSVLPWGLMLLPPGQVYLPVKGNLGWAWMMGVLVGGVLTLVLTRWALTHCEQALRRWYDTNHGMKAID